MASFLVKWTEGGDDRELRERVIPGVRGYADAAWFVALESVEDPTNAKLVDVVRLD